MKQDRLKITNYKVSGNPGLLDAQNHITPEVRSIIEQIHPAVVKGSRSMISRLNALCLQHPKVPVFKNMLSTLYLQNGEEQQAYAVNQWLQKEHPDYLFGKLNLASEFLLKKEPEKVPEILGEAMEISQLYPEREEFHLEEVLGFHAISVLYFLAVDRIEDAELRVEMMEEIAEDHPKTQQGRQQLQQWYFAKAAARKEQEDRFRKSVVLKDNRSQLQTTRPPEFHFQEQMAWLYAHDLSLPKEKIEALLALDHDLLTIDLGILLQDSIARFDHFSLEPHELEELDFPIHAVLLLSALKSEASLALVLQLLKQDRNLFDFWFGDLSTEVIDYALYHSGKEQPEQFLEFLKLPNVHGIHKCIVGEVLVAIIGESEKDRSYFIEEYRQVLSTYLEHATDENFADTEAIGFLVSDLCDLGYEELLPEIENLFDLGLVGFWISGSYEEVRQDIQREPLPKDWDYQKRDIFEQYAELGALEKAGHGVSIEEEDYFNNLYHQAFLEDDLLKAPPQEPILKPAKPGRNEPCPCGSGKKYKKCCLNR